MATVNNAHQRRQQDAALVSGCFGDPDNTGGAGDSVRFLDRVRHMTAVATPTLHRRDWLFLAAIGLLLLVIGLAAGAAVGVSKGYRAGLDANPGSVMAEEIGRQTHEEFLRRTAAGSQR